MDAAVNKHQTQPGSNLVTLTAATVTLLKFNETNKKN